MKRVLQKYYPRLKPRCHTFLISHNTCLLWYWDKRPGSIVREVSATMVKTMFDWISWINLMDQRCMNPSSTGAGIECAQILFQLLLSTGAGHRHQHACDMWCSTHRHIVQLRPKSQCSIPQWLQLLALFKHVDAFQSKGNTLHHFFSSFNVAILHGRSRFTVHLTSRQLPMRFKFAICVVNRCFPCLCESYVPRLACISDATNQNTTTLAEKRLTRFCCSIACECKMFQGLDMPFCSQEQAAATCRSQQCLKDTQKHWWR